MTAPTIGPSMRPVPPITTMKMPNAVHCTENAASGLMRRLPRKYSAPASAQPRAAMTYTASFILPTATPWLSAATSLSRMACNARPCLLRRKAYMPKRVTTTAASASA